MIIKKLIYLAFVVALGLLASCTDTSVAQTLRSLQGSGAVSFVCVGPDGRGRDINACPDFERQGNRLLALVTQTITGEVAVVDHSAGEVLDVQPAIPGFSFLPVGARPVAIVSTPDGEATFVGVAEFGRPAIFALPTSCVGPPRAGQPPRDLTTWSGCALPSAPGDMAIVLDPPLADGTVRETCPGAAPRAQASDASCPADLTNKPGGRRKLVVALPDEGRLVVIDAQGILNGLPGEFAACQIEQEIPLVSDRPATVDQPLPEDLQQPGCVEPVLEHTLSAGSPGPRPAGFALSGAELFVGDRSAPVIHRVDMSDPCAPASKPPLLPVSLEEPQRLVTTTRLAVSPRTIEGEQFLYAVDERDPGGASIMIFDVTPGATSRTPVVRPGTPRTPFEAPDRIAFSSAVRDVTFALRDVPISDATGTAVFGTFCDPVDNNSLGAGYRPSGDLSRGAGPRRLRGVFAFLLLTSGQVVVVDIEDFDAPCRRPVQTNSSPVEDFRGCEDDPESFPAFLTNNQEAGGLPNVTDEVSCRAVEPHRTRSRNYLLSRPGTGIGAPSLRAFPRLSGLGGELPTNQTDAGRQNPKLLPVDFPDAQAQVFVGTTLFVNDPRITNQLQTNPALADRSALTLPFRTARSYPPDEEVTLTYEGVVTRRNDTGFLRFLEATPDTVRDQNALFCDAGVHDVALMRQIGQQRFNLSGEELESFARLSADYVQITADFPEPDHPYWAGAGASCGGGGGLDACRLALGEASDRSLDPNRDLTIVQAFQDRLVVEPRVPNPANRELLDCCFPGAVSYAVRAGRQWLLRGSASGTRHNIVAERVAGETEEPLFACVQDCDPKKQFFTSRAFEISSRTCEQPANEEELLDCPVGPARPGQDLVCTYDHTMDPMPSIPSECVFEGLTARFAIYRGLEASERDMTFTWQTTGGFRPLAISLTAESASVLPEDLVFVPQLGQLAVVDGAALGLSFLSLDTLEVLEPIFF